MIRVFISVLFICQPFYVRGFSYEHLSNGLLSIHILVVDPNKHIITAVKANKESGRETVAVLANRYMASAAINGGFWKSNGTPAGALKINHQWLGTPVKPRGALGWSSNGSKVLIDRILTNRTFEGIEVIPLSIPPCTTAEEWKAAEYIVGGAPVLVQNGHVIEDFSPEQTLESFLIKKHARTAVGIRENGEWVFVVVDGYTYVFFGGMSIKELAQLMLDLQCMDALNLDGGGSSTLVIDGAVINDPWGTKEEEGKFVEAVSDAILIF